jgi:hypothetical protein
LKGLVWWACSGAEDKMKAHSPEQQYDVLVQRSSELKGSQTERDIEKDLLRTFPELINAKNIDSNK